MSKAKLTLQKKLAKRKYKIPSSLIFGTLSNLVLKPFLSPKYNPHYEIIDDINECKGPCFLIYNHQSRIDYVYTVEAAYPRKLNYVIGYNEFFRSHLQFVFKLLNCIPKKNFNADIPAIKAISKIIKQGGCVCISPEGMSSITGHNQPVFTGTGKLFKHHKVPVYICKLKGAFLTNHKVCLEERKGRVDVTMSKLFSPEDLEKLTIEEIEAKCDEALWHDDYEWNKTARVKFDTHGRPCEHLHDLCYRCPRCGAEFEMIGKDDELKCKACGNGAKMNDYFDFIPFDETCVIPESPSIWVDEERKVVYQEIKNNKDFVFEEKVKIGYLPKYKFLKDQKTSELCGEGTIRLTHEGFFYEGTRHGEPWSFKLTWEQLPTLGMVTDVTFFATYVDGEYYDFFPNRPTVGKILLITEEMHRLHVNKWKNFPWMSHIYED